jgi:hypothetical protein
MMFTVHVFLDVVRIVLSIVIVQRRVDDQNTTGQDSNAA